MGGNPGPEWNGLQLNFSVEFATESIAELRLENHSKLQVIGEKAAYFRVGESGSVTFSVPDNLRTSGPESS
jgi:hypothetical protein